MGKPAERIGDMDIYPMFGGLKPHVGKPVAVSVVAFLVGGMSAAVMR